MKGGDWDHPSTWIPAKKATYVIESDARGGMGQPEAVPFSDRDAAAAFALKHSGRLVAWDDIPEDYVIGGDAGSAPSMPAGMQMDASASPPDASAAGMATQNAASQPSAAMPGMTMQAGAPTDTAPAGESTE
jgi:copper chaperone NosL